jgi:hypothetical protein
LNTLLGDATLQAEAQALCLFCSWRFGTQDVVLVLAGAGEYYQIRRVTRNWSVVELNGEIYTSKTLKELKTAAKQLDYLGEDGDWTEGQEEEMYGDPSSAKDRQKTLNDKREDRTKRAKKRATRTEQFTKALNASPSTDRTTPLFSHEALNDLHRIQTSRDLFESEDPEKYFSGDGPSEWSRVLHLGSDLSNRYMTRIQDLYARSRSGKRNAERMYFLGQSPLPNPRRRKLRRKPRRRAKPMTNPRTNQRRTPRLNFTAFRGPVGRLCRHRLTKADGDQHCLPT